MNDENSGRDEDPFASGLSAVRYENVFGRRPPAFTPGQKINIPEDPALRASLSALHVRNALIEAYPDVEFQVRSRVEAEVRSIDVYYDGPKRVNPQAPNVKAVEAMAIARVGAVARLRGDAPYPVVVCPDLSKYVPEPPVKPVPAEPVTEDGLPTRADGKVYCCASLGWVTPAVAFDHRWDTSRPSEEWEERAGAWDGIEPGV